jgi:hypothetical protein
MVEVPYLEGAAETILSMATESNLTAQICDDHRILLRGIRFGKTSSITSHLDADVRVIPSPYVNLVAPLDGDRAVIVICVNTLYIGLEYRPKQENVAERNIIPVISVSLSSVAPSVRSSDRVGHRLCVGYGTNASE